MRGGLEDAAALRRLVDGAQAVVHVAGLTKARREAEFFAVNRDGSAQLAEAVAAARAELGDGAELLHYLSVPPSAALPTVRLLAEAAGPEGELPA